MAAPIGALASKPLTMYQYKTSIKASYQQLQAVTAVWESRCRYNAADRSLLEIHNSLKVQSQPNQEMNCRNINHEMF